MMFDKMHYQKENEQIFREYEKKYCARESCLIVDGVVDVEHYDGILFLLKEAYQKTKKRDTWNLVDDIAKYAPWGMWHHVAMWTHGLRNTTASDIAQYENIDQNVKNTVLRKIAAVNVKKVDGKSISDHEDLERYVAENLELLRRQIESIRPRVIVCGNTFRYLKMVFDTAPEQQCENWYYWMDLGELKHVLVLDYYHPSVRYPGLLTYYGLVNCFQQALIHEPK